MCRPGPSRMGVFNIWGQGPFFDSNKPLAIDVPADAIDSDQFNRRYKDV